MCSYPKYHEMCFIYGTMETMENSHIMHMNERFKNKNKTKSSHNQIDDLAHKKCNGVIKGWRQCLKSKSKGRFLVNNHSLDPPWRGDLKI